MHLSVWSRLDSSSLLSSSQVTFDDESLISVLFCAIEVIMTWRRLVRSSRSRTRKRHGHSIGMKRWRIPPRIWWTIRDIWIRICISNYLAHRSCIWLRLCVMHLVQMIPAWMMKIMVVTVINVWRRNSRNPLILPCNRWGWWRKSSIHLCPHDHCWDIFGDYRNWFYRYRFYRYYILNGVILLGTRSPNIIRRLWIPSLETLYRFNRYRFVFLRRWENRLANGCLYDHSLRRWGNRLADGCLYDHSYIPLNGIPLDFGFLSKTPWHCL